MNRYTSSMDHLDYLIARLQQDAATAGTWSLTRDELMAALSIELSDFYTCIERSSNPLVSFATTSYNDGNVGAMVSLGEALGWSDAPERFWRAGLFVPVEIQIELQRRIIEIAEELLELHTIDYQSFGAMFDSFPQPAKAYSLYIEEFFPWADLRDRALEDVVERHSETNGILIRPLIRQLADLLHSRGLVPFAQIFAELLERLYIYLIQSGRIDDPREHDYWSRSESRYRQGSGFHRPSDSASAAQRAALKTMGLGTSVTDLDLGQLRLRYKELMKRYHPDINPHGLEKSKEINQAFAVLSSLLAQP